MTYDGSPADFVFDRWTEGSAPIEEIRKFAEAASDPGSEGYIPKKDRIAVFDMDGTILSENNPGDMEWALYLHRIYSDPGYRATQEQKDLAEEMVQVIRTGIKPPGFTARKNRCNAEAFDGMTVGQYVAYIKDFISRPSDTYDGARRRDLFYLPMVQLMEYLAACGFTVFICSATEIINVRTTIEGIIDIPMHQVIGTEYLITASGQGDADGMSYVMDWNDDLIYTSRIQLVASGMNKVIKLIQGIGQCPAIAFGNGSGDFSMLTYVSQNPFYKGKCFMLLADDDVRDYGKPETAAKLREQAEEMGWSVISMKEDFKTIYREGIKPKFRDIGEVFGDGRFI